MLMDPATTAATIVTVLSPHLPELWRLGDKFAEGMVKKLGEKAAESITHLWQKLRGQADQQPALKSALGDLAQAPGDADLQAAQRVQLRKLILGDPALLAELTASLAPSPSGSRTQTIHGSVVNAVQGDQHTGAQNILQ